MIRISKKLQEEGLTPNLINNAFKYDYSPVQFEPGDEPVTLMRANDEEFWVKNPDGSFLKDGKSLVKFDKKTCMIARARYLLTHSEEEKKRLLDKELDRLRGETLKKSNEVLEKMKTIYKKATWSKETADVFENMLLETSDTYASEKEEEKARAVEVLNKHGGVEKVEEDIKEIEDMIQREEYDRLYISIVTDGLPLIGTFDNTEGALVDLFHHDNIDLTVEAMNSQSHLENVAMVNVTKLLKS